jgi:ubiquitin-protein ligase
MSLRLRRLQSDAQRVTAVFQQHPYIRAAAASGTPPEKYEFEFQVAGLAPDAAGEPQPQSQHRAEIFLGADYPRRPPFCRMLTPLFHPNVDPQKICIGDHWSAGQSLVELVVRIAQMICFQSYNVQSPLNAKAAAWVAAHLDRLPLMEADLTVGL